MAAANAAPSQTGLEHKHKHVCSAKPATDSVCTSEVVTDASGVRPAATPTYANGYQPTDLQSAYGLSGVSSANGAGKTVAIVDAYDLPTAAQDLATYRAQFHLPPMNPSAGGGPTFTKVNQTGGATPPAVDSGWGQEIALDLDMASAICPNCNILLVEASTSSMANLADCGQHGRTHSRRGRDQQQLRRRRLLRELRLQPPRHRHHRQQRRQRLRHVLPRFRPATSSPSAAPR